MNHQAHTFPRTFDTQAVYKKRNALQFAVKAAEQLSRDIGGIDRKAEARTFGNVLHRLGCIYSGEESARVVVAKAIMEHMTESELVTVLCHILGGNAGHQSDAFLDALFDTSEAFNAAYDTLTAIAEENETLDPAVLFDAGSAHPDNPAPARGTL